MTTPGPYTYPCGIKEIAAWSGYEPDTIKKWRTRHPDFPAPEWTVGGDPAWNWPKVSHWLHATDRWDDGIRRRLIRAGIDETLIHIDRDNQPGAFLIHRWDVRPHYNPTQWAVTPPPYAAMTNMWVGDTPAMVRLVRRPPLLIAGIRLADGRVTTSYGIIDRDEAARRTQGHRYVTADVLAERAGAAHLEADVHHWLAAIGEVGPWSDQATTDLIDRWWADWDTRHG
jgi:hypothetical protein